MPTQNPFLPHTLLRCGNLGSLVLHKSLCPALAALPATKNNLKNKDYKDNEPTTRTLSRGIYTSSSSGEGRGRARSGSRNRGVLHYPPSRHQHTPDKKIPSPSLSADMAEEEKYMKLEEQVADEKSAGRGGRGGGRRGGGESREVVVSKALSKLLRHAAGDAGIVLDGEGFAPLDRVVSFEF